MKITYADMADAVAHAHRIGLDVAFRLHAAGDDAAVDEIESYIAALNAAQTELRRMARERGEAVQ